MFPKEVNSRTASAMLVREQTSSNFIGEMYREISVGVSNRGWSVRHRGRDRYDNGVAVIPRGRTGVIQRFYGSRQGNARYVKL